MNKTLWLLALALSAGISLWAAGFWEKKNFAEWSDKEVRQMIADSPWAHRVDLVLGSAGGGGGGGRGGRGGRGGGGGAGGAGDMGAIGSAATGGLDAGGGVGRSGTDTISDSSQMSTIPVVIRWQSSLPVRQALAKSRWGKEVATSPDAAKLLGKQEDFYIVSVSGVPGRLLEVAASPSLKASSFLRVGKLGPIPAVDVKVARGAMLAEVFLVFPRAQPGAHIITLEDQEVEVVTRLGSIEARRRFRLKEMVYDGKLEL